MGFLLTQGTVWGKSRTELSFLSDIHYTSLLSSPLSPFSSLSPPPLFFFYSTYLLSYFHRIFMPKPKLPLKASGASSGKLRRPWGSAGPVLCKAGSPRESCSRGQLSSVCPLPKCMRGLHFQSQCWPNKAYSGHEEARETPRVTPRLAPVCTKK